MLVEFLVDDNINEFSGGELYFSFEGKVDVFPECKNTFEHQSPFDPTVVYCDPAGVYFCDSLNITLIANKGNYAKLYYAALRTIQKPCYVIWRTSLGLQYRKIKGTLPFPDKLRFLKDSVSFKINSEPYFEVIEDMRDITKTNRRWNVATIANTAWN